MKKRAGRLQKVSLTSATVQLSPRATAGMAIGASGAQPQPAAISTAHRRAEVPRGVHDTRASVG
jgi:hypothetical protein